MMSESLGQRLQRFRKRANLTQEEVATKLNITPQAISKWENDVSAPDISLLGEIADMFGVTVDELLGRQPQTIYLPEGPRKPIDSLMLKIKVLSTDGDKVNVNLPLALVKVFTQSGMEIPQINGNDALKNIDFNQILSLCEQGLLGKLVDVQSADGDIVEIWVE
ncbi:MAG: helix-turn-helix transcriptional regulator [Clostridia bacterium]|nr:helix-turn-helix transcriptional regulator [Clostridia bacterium]